MTPAQTMLRAAVLLEEDASAGRESCRIGDREWACDDCPGKRGGVCTDRVMSEERARVAASLKLLAGLHR